MPTLRRLPFLFLLLAPAGLSAQETRGYAEVRAHLNLGVDGAPAQLVERVRPTFIKAFTERFALSATVEAAFTQGRNLQDELERTLTDSDLGPILEAAGCTWPVDANETLDISEAQDFLSVERLYLDAYLPRVDLRLGRQPVNWGSAMVVNPTDPFPEVLAVEPWKPRAGVNAFRATVPIGEAHQLQAVVGSNDTFTSLRLAGRATAGLGLTDLSVMGAWRPEANNGVVGLDVRGTLGVGYWLEGALHLREASAGDPYEELAVGIDYSFAVLERLMVSAQYYRNGAGGEETASAVTTGSFGGVQGPDCGDSGALFGGGTEGTTDRFAPYFRGRDYGMLSVAASVNSEVALSALWIQNLGDGSAMAVPVVSLSPTGWLELSAAAQIPFSLWGDGGELNPSEEDLVLDVNTGGAPIQVDMNGLVADATVTVWARVSF